VKEEIKLFPNPGETPRFASSRIVASHQQRGVTRESRPGKHLKTENTAQVEHLLNLDTEKESGQDEREEALVAFQKNKVEMQKKNNNKKLGGWSRLVPPSISIPTCVSKGFLSGRTDGTERSRGMKSGGCAGLTSFGGGYFGSHHFFGGICMIWRVYWICLGKFTGSWFGSGTGWRMRMDGWMDGIWEWQGAEEARKEGGMIMGRAGEVGGNHDYSNF